MSTAIGKALAAAITAFEIDYDPSSQARGFIKVISNCILRASAQNGADAALSRAFSFVNECFHNTLFSGSSRHATKPCPQLPHSNWMVGMLDLKTLVQYLFERGQSPRWSG